MPSTRKQSSTTLYVPVTYYKLANGLKVVLCPDRAVPLATVAVYFGVGFRAEPRDRTGFAHLFEHLMLEGTASVRKHDLFQVLNELGSRWNGSTRLDFTCFYQVLPSNGLRSALWIEADRMRTIKVMPDDLRNQQCVVREEIKSGVLDVPYGGFPWLLLPQCANEKWCNAHDFYGDISHIDAATIEEVHQFFDAFYGPSNAVLVVAGDLDITQTESWIEETFGSIPPRSTPPATDSAEEKQCSERHATVTDVLAANPAIAVGYHLPDRWTSEYFAFGILDQILLQGRAARLHRKLVQQHAYTDAVRGGINHQLGNMFDCKNPMLWTVWCMHSATTSPADILAALDDCIQSLRDEPVTPSELELARISLHCRLLDTLGSGARLELADLLACLAMFDDDPGRINEINDAFASVTPQLIWTTADEYLRSRNRTVMVLRAGNPVGGLE
jgi:zinc protease